MDIERGVVDRLERMGLRWYVTGSWALAAYAEPRMTRDIDIVLDAALADYEGGSDLRSSPISWSTTRSTSAVGGWAD
ncbi:MAG: hypothetical protein WKF78_00865 [Candidatus Limnocylindrales bacterium]